MGPVRNVTEYGNAMLLSMAMEDLKPLSMTAFPDNWGGNICSIHYPDLWQCSAQTKQTGMG
jgi:hypothetical protein